MWLSETAVDMESLGILADQGIRYTVLAPHQAKRIRRLGFGSRWQYVHNESVDPKRAYRVLLDWGKQFHVFFYDGPISRAIAFQGLLYNGDQLDHKLMNAFAHWDGAQLVHTATDGESFGHHHKFGEMAIAYGMKKIQDHHMASIANYAEFLDKFGSQWEAEIYPNSSWSCAHGVERWRSDCGCRLNFEEGWNQKWRTVLRDAFDYLQEIVDEVYEEQTEKLLKDPWRARNDFVDLMLEDTPERRRQYFSKNARRALSADQERKLIELLEAEKFSLFMYTSCGWFFDDISGIEPVQCMKFALRALELVQTYYPKDIESALLGILVKARSNVKGVGTGADVFRNYVKPSRVVKIYSSEKAVKNGV
jgi:alpha-amylase/alpha-mannosidase (GH57 family)